jgi:ferredoxin-like protein FixX
MFSHHPEHSGEWLSLWLRVEIMLKRTNFDEVLKNLRLMPSKRRISYSSQKICHCSRTVLHLPALPTSILSRRGEMAVNSLAVECGTCMIACICNPLSEIPSKWVGVQYRWITKLFHP